ncbi:DUF4232 domain-containing protein [Saccharopolyspora rhizosphaerae]|uniref:DUF4232 domain-containing protein n=1 Tax=Saccharopolyspora rhizosphaerae TaxID=2492662 RepID=UPI001F3EEA92|nr:DUF4232 domain-containing protein [Saccharopolyspora rhizosphaerae]
MQTSAGLLAAGALAGSALPAQGQDAPEPRYPRCQSAQLTGSMSPVQAGAGQRYADLTLTNSGDARCTLQGYGGMELVDAAGNPLPTTVTRAPDPGPTLLDLDPGESAAATLHWSTVPHGDEGDPCQPVAAGLRVIPPDETEPLPVEWTGDTVCGEGSLDGTAYHQG